MSYSISSWDEKRSLYRRCSFSSELGERKYFWLHPTWRRSWWIIGDAVHQSRGLRIKGNMIPYISVLRKRHWVRWLHPHIQFSPDEDFVITHDCHAKKGLEDWCLTRFHPAFYASEIWGCFPSQSHLCACGHRWSRMEIAAKLQDQSSLPGTSAPRIGSEDYWRWWTRRWWWAPRRLYFEATWPWLWLGINYRTRTR